MNSITSVPHQDNDVNSAAQNKIQMMPPSAPRLMPVDHATPVSYQRTDSSKHLWNNDAELISKIVEVLSANPAKTSQWQKPS